ncbi:hypothetical protein [Mycobacterium paraseoulense]|uniref:Antitermination protein NusB n=1 Tax=Mycobacterium paraseoulense TaxID=590652 RepID=A0A1X0I3X5_9MYCO|nr:hypothetical protein [Mycobacterium paraseoulense]MCV7396019.1 hypothetical protein [Mycobacterium paraseoulense]ORB34293.1 hypothetical protein BST39_24395 [Mycobacterium paraseoulense]BBZ70797.1 hypothetical protein MPRS_18900 [Mycobacterium paraseoulense]
MTGTEASLIALFWLTLALVTGLIANNKGHTFWGYFLVTLFVLGPLGLLMALLMARKPDEQSKGSK